MFCLIFLILFSISLKLTKYERRKIERYLELLSKAVNDLWKFTRDFNITVSQENLNKWSVSGDINNLVI